MRSIFSRFFVCIATALAAAAAPAVTPLGGGAQFAVSNGAAAVRLRVNSTNLSVAGVLNVSLEVRAAADAAVRLPKAPVIEGFRQAGEPLSETEEDGGSGTVRRVDWVYYPEQTGATRLPPLEIRAGGTVLRTPAVVLHVRSVLPATAEETPEPLDIVPPVKFPPALRETFRLALFLLFVAFLVSVVIMVFWLRAKLRELRSLSPADEALRALDRLPADPAARIHEINRLLRRYLERRFSIPALERTNRELLPFLEGCDLGPLTSRLIDFFRDSDAVRFSGREPGDFPAEAEAFARRFIEETRKREEEADGKEEA